MNALCDSRRVWAIVPAAGSGRRFAAASAASATAAAPPKQYSDLLGKSVLEWTLRALLSEPRIHAIVVALSAGDPYWPPRRLSRCFGKNIDGARRGVAAGLRIERSGIPGVAEPQPDDWVLVHDAARPCLGAGDLRALIDTLSQDATSCSGAVLAAPIVDTMKREGASRAGDCGPAGTMARVDAAGF